MFGSIKNIPNKMVYFKNGKKRRNIKENIELYAIMLPVLIHIFIFSYIPMSGIVIAFQDYVGGNRFFAFDGSIKWVGLKHFIDFTTNMYFWRLIKNTVVLSGLNILIVFWIPIMFALLLNEVRAEKYRKIVQTISYLPYFISSVVVASMVISFIKVDGIFNQIRRALGLEAIAYNNSPGAFPWVYMFTNMWKTFGFDSILYLAAITSIDINLYEAARLDGATRWRQIWHITLPSIFPTIMIMLILRVGSLLSANSEMILLMYNPAVYETADVVGTYIYRDSLLTGRFSFGTAVGLFTSIINMALVLGSNYVARKTTDYSLW